MKKYYLGAEHEDYCGVFYGYGCNCYQPAPTLVEAKDLYDKAMYAQTALVMEGQKNDADKDWRPGLIAPEFIKGVATVLAFGAKKYAAGNWAKGMAWSRPIDALDRHWTAWKGGERCDPETGHSHLWHVGCCLMFLVAYEARGIGRDDRAESGLGAKWAYLAGEHQ